ncbi:MAG: hypothetical protein IPK26_03060 [Planctomycetes bacterium]|nr:hypothetical protein [Planctomycetota bacterium]
MADGRKCRPLIAESANAGIGSHLSLDPTRALPSGQRMWASFRVIATDRPTGSEIARGTISLEFAVGMPAPQVVQTGLFANASLPIVPMPGSNAVGVDLGGLSFTLPHGPATLDLEFGGEAVGSDGPVQPFEEYGSGCVGPFGEPLLSGSGSPLLGNTYQLDLTNAPPFTVAMLAVGFNNTSWSGLPLPLDMVLWGAPGCLIQASPDLTQLVFTSGGAA